MEDRKIRVGITQGDINGIGYEVILKTFSDQTMFDLCTPIVYGSPKAIAYHRKAMDIQTNFNIINECGDAEDMRLNVLTCYEEEVKIEFGTPSVEGGKTAYVSLEKAMDDYNKGLIDVLVTAPINKADIQSDDFKFVGHTEWLQSKFENSEALMILLNDVIKVALVTTHVPIKDISSTINQEMIVSKLRILNNSLKRDFQTSIPRIAVFGLNPHAGDGGLLGDEEQNIISPAIEEARKEEIQAFGPYAADGFFGSGMINKFDAVLAMYHDQGLAAFKAMSMDDGVNFTAGLPIVRTSPDHGTAFDIAGKGIASENSLRHAIYTAVDVFRNRISFDEACVNPLPKLYKDRRDRSES